VAHVVNVSTRVFPFEIGTSAGKPPVRIEMKPGDVVEVEDAYGKRRAPSPAADTIPSVVELMTNGCVLPASDPRAAAAYKAWLEKQTPVAVVTAEAASAPVRPASPPRSKAG
jgi:hypothetical protein